MAAYQYQQGARPLDGYTIQYALGRGGFGEVYFAVSDAGREVALKVVQHFEDIELRGIRHCMNLKSQHLVTIFDVKCAADGTPWIIMEYVAGPSLREIIDESPTGLGLERSAFLFCELAKGIRYLHDAGVVHRDLKPHNVFFEDGTVKIGDYSLSKAITTSHRSGHTMTVGSVHYMAPEISMGRYDKTVDIYALGIILYEMIRGAPPYVGESMGEVLMKHLSSQPDLTGISEPFASTIAKAMSREPSKRFQSAQLMAESLLSSQELGGQLQTFNPLTLSMVGQRSEQLKINRAKRTSQPLSETFTSPAMLRDTKAVDAVISADAPPERISWWQRFGLWYFQSDIVDRNPDRVGAAVRIAIAAFVSALLSLYGTLFGTVTTLRSDEIAFAMILQLSVALLLCIGMLVLSQLSFGNWIWCGFTIGKRYDNQVLPRIGFGLVSRAVLVGVAFVILSQTAYNSPGDKERMLLGVVGGVLLSLMILDWRCFAAPHRPHRILILPTVAAGLIALFSSIIVLGESRSEVVSAAFAMSLAIGLQLVAPLRRAKLNASRADSALHIHTEKSEQEPKPANGVDETQEIFR